MTEEIIMGAPLVTHPKGALLAAASLIEDRGLSHGSWVAPDDKGLLLLTRCKACTGGALALAVSDNQVETPLYIIGKQRLVLEEAVRILGTHLGIVPEGDMLDAVIDWNDAHSQEEVVDALRAASAAAPN